MQLIAPLASGIVGAENGSVALYRRGSSTRATYYSDFEGASAVTPTANVTLDSDGRAVLYVNELVTCTVYDSGGGEVVSFVAGIAASAVEIVSRSFTGTDYETGASAHTKPTTAASIADRWYETNGASDWKVLVGGAAVSLQSALSSVGGLVYNVMTYGATGDGTTDDTTALQAAITACNVAGGGIVWLPEGSYRTTAVLTVPDKVSVVGAGAHCTTISCDHATANLMTFSGSTTARWQELAGLRLMYAQTSSGVHLTVATGSLLRLTGCDIGTATQVAASTVLSASSTTVFVAVDTIFRQGDGAAGTCVTTLLTAKNTWFRGCTFRAAAAPAYDRLLYGDYLTCIGCTFDFSACTTSANIYGFYATTNVANSTIVGCVFTADGGGSCTSTAIKLGTPGSTAIFYESDNTFLCDTAYSYTIAAAGNGMSVHLGSRIHRVKVDAHTGASYIAPVQQYGVIKMVSTEAGNVTITTDGDLPLGSRVTIIVDNDDGSNRTFTPISTIFTTSGAKTINTTQGNSMDCVSVEYQETGVATMRLMNEWAE